MISHLLMALGFAIASAALCSIRRYTHAIIFLLALGESFAGIRYPLHVVMRDLLLRHDHDLPKLDLQRDLLIGFGAVCVLALTLLLPPVMRLSPGRRLMMLGSLAVVAMLGVELISIHWIDAVIYHAIGPFALCAIIYFAGAMTVAGGAFIERRRQRVGSVVAV